MGFLWGLVPNLLPHWPRTGVAKKSGAREMVFKKGVCDFTAEPWTKRVAEMLFPGSHGAADELCLAVNPGGETDCGDYGIIRNLIRTKERK